MKQMEATFAQSVQGDGSYIIGHDSPLFPAKAHRNIGKIVLKPKFYPPESPILAWHDEKL